MNTLAAGSFDGSVRFYQIGSGNYYTVWNSHHKQYKQHFMRERRPSFTPKVTAICALTGSSHVHIGSVASVGEDGRLVTYFLRQNDRPKALNLGEPLSMITVLDEDRFGVTNFFGSLRVVKHNNGFPMVDTGN